MELVLMTYQLRAPFHMHVYEVTVSKACRSGRLGHTIEERSYCVKRRAAFDKLLSIYRVMS